jgi:peptidyl-prolyl cis-trans isomerase C
MIRRRRLSRAYRGLVVVAGFSAAATACSNGGAPTPSDARLGGNVVARVGDEEIQADTVRRIARAQNISPKEALDRAVFDALLAQEAKAKRGPLGSVETAGALVRRLTVDLRDEALSQGPVRAEEIAPLAARDWFTVARPRSLRTVHVLVRVPEGAEAATWDRATEVAARLRAALEPAGDLARKTPGPELVYDSMGELPADAAAASFLKTSSAVGAEGFEIVAQPLPLVAADRRVILPASDPSQLTQELDADFTKAAFALQQRGDISPPVRSAFGVHVIMLLDVLPESVLDDAALHARYDDAVIDLRARALATRIREDLAKTVPVDVDRAADALLEAVQVRQ